MLEKFKFLKGEVSRLKKELRDKDNDTKKITIMWMKAEKLAKDKETKLTVLTQKTKKLEQANQKCRESIKLVLESVEGRLQEKDNRNELLKQDLVRQLSQAESALTNCQAAFDKLKRSYETVQQNLDTVVKKYSESSTLLKSKLEEKHRAMLLLESEVQRKSSESDAAWEKLDKQSSLIRNLRKDKEVAESFIEDARRTEAKAVNAFKALEEKWQSTSENESQRARDLEGVIALLELAFMR